MTPPLVSVVIPCYNAKDYLPDAIVSVHDQDYPNIEIIIVDDGSTDGSTDVVKDIPFVQVLTFRKNFGACLACEVGFSKASGKYVCMLAADDMFIRPDHIGDQVDTLEQTGADWCYNTITLSGKCLCLTCARTIQSKWLLTHHLDNLFLKFPRICSLIVGVRNPVNSSALMFRKSSYDANNLSWMRYGARSICDGGILATMFELRMRGVAIHSIGSFYRDHPKQVSKDQSFLTELERRRRGAIPRLMRWWKS